MTDSRIEHKIRTMREGGHLLAEIMQDVLARVKPGITGIDLDSRFDELVKKHKVESAFKHYQGYPAHLCISHNTMIIHGIPTATPYQNGDIVSIDMGIKYKGYYLDMTRNQVVGKDIHHLGEFLQAGYEALNAAERQAKVGKRVGDIGHAVQSVIERKYNYRVSRHFVGHGVSNHLHEDPYVPGYGQPGQGEQLTHGQTLAIEVIYIKGKQDRYVTAPDGWTIFTRNGEYAAVVEDTVLVTPHGGEVLTTTG